MPTFIALKLSVTTSIWHAPRVIPRVNTIAFHSEIVFGRTFGVLVVNPLCPLTGGYAPAGCRGGVALGPPNGLPLANFFSQGESSIYDWNAAPIAMPLILLYF